MRKRAKDFQRQFEKMGYHLYLISGRTGEGLEELMETVSQKLESISGLDNG